MFQFLLRASNTNVPQSMTTLFAGCNVSLTFGVDNYSTYNKFLRAGDFNIPSGDDPLQNLLTDIDSNCLVKVPTCIRNVESPSTITNCPL